MKTTLAKCPATGNDQLQVAKLHLELTNCSRHLAAAIGGEENNQKQSDDHGHSVKKLISQSFVCFLLITELASRVTAGSHTDYICE